MKTFKSYLKEQEQHKVGDFWQTKPGIWGGKNPDGDIEYYHGGNAKQMSQAWAKDQTKKRGKVSADGEPKVAGAKVTATILEHGRERKILVYKKKRRKGYARKNGHRQWFTNIEIQNIQVSKAKAKPAAKPKKAEPKEAKKEK